MRRIGQERSMPKDTHPRVGFDFSTARLHLLYFVDLMGVFCVTGCRNSVSTIFDAFDILCANAEGFGYTSHGVHPSPMIVRASGCYSSAGAFTTLNYTRSCQQ